MTRVARFPKIQRRKRKPAKSHPAVIVNIGVWKARKLWGAQ